MESVTTKRFQKCYASLPLQVQQAAKRAYLLWKNNNMHPSLHFKQIHDEKPIYSVRISLSYRALGVKKDDTII